ncbi:MAG: hypothetical protein A3E91_01995 [Candidatus Moranbacteria bacterium RIFCSPHIGHO2_12_FULL_40_10]|nr:MAG: hypothetical protein A3E91_01995 [Candidatus Moranbacteria bacterium RIFCSPHIGHO2_12_FULL_40_10]
MFDEIKMEAEIEKDHFHCPDCRQDKKEGGKIRNEMQSQKVSDEKRDRDQKRMLYSDSGNYPGASIGKSDKNQGSDEIMENNPRDGIANFVKINWDKNRNQL